MHCSWSLTYYIVKNLAKSQTLSKHFLGPKMFLL